MIKDEKNLQRDRIDIYYLDRLDQLQIDSNKTLSYRLLVPGSVGRIKIKILKK